MVCSVKDNCFNNGQECDFCRFAPGNENYMAQYYAPIDKKIVHPVLLKEKESRKHNQKQERKLAKSEKDKDKTRLLKKAAQTEQRVKNTLNSGRANKDGDLKTADISIDVKLQSTHKHPVINIDEFDKIQNDARRGNNKHGILIIENESGRRFVVMSEQLFGELI